MMYPNLKPIEESRARRSIVADARSVASRVGCRAWFDSWRRAFVFGLVKDHHVALYDILVGIERGFDPVSGWKGPFGDRGVDGAVSYLNRSKMDPREQDRIRKQFSDAAERERRESAMRMVEAYRPEFRSMDKFRDKKLSMGRHHKGIVTVP